MQTGPGLGIYRNTAGFWEFVDAGFQDVIKKRSRKTRGEPGRYKNTSFSSAFEKNKDSQFKDRRQNFYV